MQVGIHLPHIGRKAGPDAIRRALAELVEDPASARGSRRDDPARARFAREHLAGDAHRDLGGAGVHGRGVADGQAALVQERGVDIHLAGRVVPAAGDEAVCPGSQIRRWS